MIIVTLKYVFDHHARRQQGRGRKPRPACPDQPHRRRGRQEEMDRRASSCSACSRRRCSTAIQHDHSGDLGAVGGRGPDHGPGRFRALCRPDRQSPSCSGCSPSSRAARPGSGCCSGRSCWSISSTLAVLGIVHIMDHPDDHLRDAQPAERDAASIWLEPLPAFIAMGSRRAGGHRRGGALRRHGPFRPPPDQVQLALFRHAGADPQLYGAGGDAAVAGACAGAGDRQEPVLLPRAGDAAAAAGHSGDAGDRSSPARR